MNVILITVDCLRADHLSCLGYSKQTTPNLDSLANEGLLFTQAMSVGPGTPTSFTAMFTSTYPLMYGGKLYITNSRTTVAQVLERHGYSTAAFHSNPWVSSFFGYHRGFGTFDDGARKWKVESLLSKPKALAEQVFARTGRLYSFLYLLYSAHVGTNLFGGAEVTNKKAISWLRGKPDNYFLWVHYMDTHEPYLSSSRFTSPLRVYPTLALDAKARNSPRRLSPQEVGRLIDIYDSRVHHVDEKIGSLLRTPESINMRDKTFVIVTADHGQQFLEHGWYGHGRCLYDELTHVPLIIAGPGLESHVIKQQVSLLDLAPTILDMLNIEKPRAFLGDSLLPLISGSRANAGSSEAISETDTLAAIKRFTAEIRPQLDANYRRISLRTGKWKYIYTEDEEDELYHLEVDPKETRNVIDVEPGTATELRAKIMAHIEFVEKSKPSDEEVIKANIRRLKASGRI